MAPGSLRNACPAGGPRFPPTLPTVRLGASEHTRFPQVFSALRHFGSGGRPGPARQGLRHLTGLGGPGGAMVGWAGRERSGLGRTGLQPASGPHPRGEAVPHHCPSAEAPAGPAPRRACARGGAEAAHAPYRPRAPKARPRWRRPRRGREAEGARGAVSGLPRAGNGPSAVGASAGLASCQANGSNCRRSLLLTLPLGRPLPPVPATVRLPRFPRPAAFVWLPPPQPLAGGRAGGAVNRSTPLSLPPCRDWSFPPRELPVPVPAAPAAGHRPTRAFAS
ncbi:PREDICTED: basic salivary proline-rich protein 1-like [Haliaeetus leucocephalus]|uniref:basic salivary proline-rich protein 1-like n=1 Tax=Haliaeetus leucocephalus TaxID=52644 RepID=UPI00053CB387|nr:PREDICTED: basic salivary proline-rich protein 1-like [Haliaeetus leucocephalus]